MLDPVEIFGEHDRVEEAGSLRFVFFDGKGEVGQIDHRWDQRWMEITYLE